MTEKTFYKWKHRESAHDRSNTPHRLQTTLIPAHEAVAVVLRKTLLVSIDGLLAVVREFQNLGVSRSGLDCCVRQHGAGNPRERQAKSLRPQHNAFKAYEPDYPYVDGKCLPKEADETTRRYLLVATDLAIHWVFVRGFKSKAAANARSLLHDLERACSLRIRTILTDNGNEFIDRLFGLRKRVASGNQEFDQLCADLGVERRLVPPLHPHTNGMVDRFKGRIEEKLQSHRFQSGEGLETALDRYYARSTISSCATSLGQQYPIAGDELLAQTETIVVQGKPYYLTRCDT